jgi:hypothetical protein
MDTQLQSQACHCSNMQEQINAITESLLARIETLKEHTIQWRNQAIHMLETKAIEIDGLLESGETGGKTVEFSVIPGFSMLSTLDEHLIPLCTTPDLQGLFNYAIESGDCHLIQLLLQHSSVNPCYDDCWAIKRTLKLQNPSVLSVLLHDSRIKENKDILINYFYTYIGNKAHALVHSSYTTETEHHIQICWEIIELFLSDELALDVSTKAYILNPCWLIAILNNKHEHLLLNPRFTSKESIISGLLHSCQSNNLTILERLLQTEVDPSRLFTIGYGWIVQAHCNRHTKSRLLQDKRIQAYLTEHPSEKSYTLRVSDAPTGSTKLRGRPRLRSPPDADVPTLWLSPPPPDT